MSLKAASKEQLVQLVHELILTISNTTEDDYLREVVNSIDEELDIESSLDILRRYNRGDEP